MEYINDININEAVIHILDSNGEEPILNEYSLDLDEDIYAFLYKHIEKCFKDDELKYGRFNPERNIVKEVVQDYLIGITTDLVVLSKELARQLFIIMKGNINIPAGDLIIVSIVTDQGPMIGILKMDYVKNFTHEVQFVNEKIGIGIVPQVAGLPGSGQKIQKAAFIKPIKDEDNYNLMILDKQKSSNEDEYGANYFINTFLGATIVTNERDMTRTFVKAAENWTRKNVTEDAGKAEEIRTAIKTKLKEEDTINIDEFSAELFKEQPQVKEDFSNYIKQQGLEEVAVDKTWVDKKLKRVRLNIDKQIDLYINEETYHDSSKFEIQRNGDGTINLVVKNVINYIEK
ncbi:nucleoid-associated protein [Clostridium saccharobutylicum]|uniref:37-kD nucleoid-associated bacterial protein n=1 Tax=Clostridium saccharobutylicum DSM 13864 TaxID=1345695 RepID=U5MPV4_CLOSA|nr:nucleoid-associated protein [Clostridium saccharobutylicum]AGX41721.1 37-kD nucleoid-associated bacterial protein [Clostridium saccharobutylicum DSM 13864]AQR89001.1 37-kD nucleoid-associated bacterial protein [Clostridium saccharobutylicum]AQR98902.1 37-kD nucleoid-associated bacterial protein [Clostridium saccharobutylicum]AQS08621.1 37-kD nucleoid-associated bacterial protein [Clostridium saccharobutylicum]AQS12890.1 37-kD nucleoid-associated bacterial protein [Clostridium saccharobutyli